MPTIEIGNNRIMYKFDINGKYSLVKGDSGTGKTTLCDLVSMFERGVEGVINKSSHTIMILPTRYKQFDVLGYKDAVIFVDEESTLLRDSNYEQWLKTVDAYFVFITRDLRLKTVPISVDSIYTVQTSGKFHYLKPIDARFPNQKLCGADLILTEDSKSGMQFIKEVVKYANSAPKR